jgi:hypothetical protein
MMIDINDYSIVRDQGDVRNERLENLLSRTADHSEEDNSLVRAPCRAAEGELNTLLAIRNSVELDGIEPTTSGLQSQRSPN